MRCRVAYRIGKPPRWWTSLRTGILSIDEAGVRINGPAPYRADFSAIRGLNFRHTPGGRFYIALGASPPVYFTPILASFSGFVQVVHPPLNAAVYTELHRRLGGPGRCTECGHDFGVARRSCPACGGSVVTPVAPRRTCWRTLAVVALAAGLALQIPYVGSYYYLSRRGMREGKVYNLSGFLYVPAEEVLATRDTSRHHARAGLYAPLNWLDRKLLGSSCPVGGFTWGLSKK